MWRLVNDLANNKIKDESSAPPKLIVNNVLITELVIICDTFNEYFSMIGTTLDNAISSNFHNNFSYFLPCIDNLYNELPIFEPCTTDDIYNIINELDSNSSTYFTFS